MARILFALVVALSAGAAFGGPRDPATLFPERPLAYVEVAKPAEAIKQINVLIKGSVFEDALPAINKIRDKQGRGTFIDTSAAGIFATIVGPEMRKEAARFDGAAAALLGFNKQNDPEWVAILLTGESQLPAFLIRGYLSAHSEIRKIGAADGVDLYQERFSEFVDDPLLGVPNVPDRDAPATEIRTTGPVFGFKEGAVVLASDKAAATTVLRRLNGSEKGKSLADNAGFQSLRKKDFNGLFVYADAKALAGKGAGDAAVTNRIEPSAAFLVRKLLPAESLRDLGAYLSVEADRVVCDAVLKTDPAAANPLGRLLSGPPVSIGGDPAGAVSLKWNLPPGPQRVDAVLQLVDGAIKATGTLGPSGTEILGDLEQRKLLTREALAKVNSITVLLPPAASWKDGKRPLPTLLLEAEDDESLQAVAGVIPAILELLGGKPADAVTETIDGIKVRSLEAKASPFERPTHYAVARGALAIGEDRNCLAPFLKSNSRAESSETGFPLVAHCGWPELTAANKSDPKQPVIGRPTQLFVRDGVLSSTGPDQGPSAVFPPDLMARMKDLPPLAVMMSANRDEIRMRVVQSDPKGARANVMNHWFNWFAANSGGTLYRRGVGYSTSDEVVPPILLPPQIQIGPP